MADRTIYPTSIVIIPGLPLKQNETTKYVTSIVIQDVGGIKREYLTVYPVDPKTGKSIGLKQDEVASRDFNTPKFQIRSEEELKATEAFSDPKKANKVLNDELNNSIHTRNNIDRSVRLSDYFYKGNIVPANDPSIIDLTKAAVINPANADLNRGESGTQPPTDGSLSAEAKIEDLNEAQIAFLEGYTPPGKFGLLMYPKDISENQDIIRIDVVEYLPRKLSTVSKFTFDPRYDYKSPQKEEILKGSIFLPIQPNLSDKNSVNWSGDDSMNAFELLAAGVAASGIIGQGGQMVDDIIKVIESQQGPDKKISETAKVGLRALLARAATPGGSGNMFLSRLKGAVMNPNMELLFSNPNLRNFSLNFKFVPRSQAESEEVIKIIRVLKEYSAVQRGVLDLFLKAPHVFQIRYAIRRFNKDGKIDIVEHPAINKMKLCALQTVSVDYIPDGTYATRSDGGMTAYQMSLQFGELEPIYADDYKNIPYNADPAIGY